MRPLVLTLSLLPACLLRPVPDDDTSTTDTPSTTSTSTTDDPPPTTTTPLKPDASDDPPTDCDGFQQLDPECRPDQKCTIDGSLSATHCVNVLRDPKGLYEPCKALGDGSGGFDDCDLGLLCWDVDAQGHGTCIGLCDGDGSECTCADPKTELWLCPECAVGLCYPSCDPLIQDCPDDQLCIPQKDHIFTCDLDGSGDEGQINDPCEIANGCDPGLICLNTATASSACMPDPLGCCQPFCDFSKNAPCPNPDQKCVQWYDPMNETPEGMEDVGVCAIPA